MTVTQEFPIRRESTNDIVAIRRINEATFRRSQEAAMVAALREARLVTLSLVAADPESGQLVGHILFSPVEIRQGDRVTRAESLAPVAVLPHYQRRGIGSALVRTGLDLLRADGHSIVTVLGHPTYYPRFGFEVASGYNITPEFADVPPEAFMVLALRPNALDEVSGTVVYPSAVHAAM